VSPVVVFKKEKIELIELLESSDLDFDATFCAAEAKTGNLYLFAIGQRHCADGGIDAIKNSKAIAHA
jgi:hypothetical protein